MDNKITKTRIKTFLSYDLIKVVAVALILCFASLIIFNWVAEKPSTAQSFYVLCDVNVIIGEEGDMLPVETANKGAKNGGFSYDILEVSTKNLEVGAYNTSYMLRTSVGVGDDDIFIAGETLGREYLEGYSATDIVGLVERAKEYCVSNGFYTESGTINEEKIKQNFLKTRKGDNRFRKSSDKEKGVALEIQRIKTVWENANLLEKVFNEHSEIFSDKFSSFTWGEREITGSFAIDLSKLTDGDSQNVLSNAFKLSIQNQETGEISYTTEGIYLFVGNNEDINGDLDYESLAYIRTIIEKYSNFI